MLNSALPGLSSKMTDEKIDTFIYYTENLLHYIKTGEIPEGDDPDESHT